MRGSLSPFATRRSRASELGRVRFGFVPAAVPRARRRPSGAPSRRPRRGRRAGPVSASASAPTSASSAFRACPRRHDADAGSGKAARHRRALNVRGHARTLHRAAGAGRRRLAGRAHEALGARGSVRRAMGTPRRRPASPAAVAARVPAALVVVVVWAFALSQAGALRAVRLDASFDAKWAFDDPPSCSRRCRPTPSAATRREARVAARLARSASRPKSAASSARPRAVRRDRERSRGCPAKGRRWCSAHHDRRGRAGRERRRLGVAVLLGCARTLKDASGPTARHLPLLRRRGGRARRGPSRRRRARGRRRRGEREARGTLVRACSSRQPAERARRSRGAPRARRDHELAHDGGVRAHGQRHRPRRVRARGKDRAQLRGHRRPDAVPRGRRRPRPPRSREPRAARVPRARGRAPPACPRRRGARGGRRHLRRRGRRGGRRVVARHGRRLGARRARGLRRGGGGGPGGAPTCAPPPRPARACSARP